MNKFLLPFFASLLMVYSSQAQQATPTPRDPATASDATEADTQKIRQAVMKDGSLSMSAKNAKIIAQDGKITLKGPVDSQQEKDTIGAEAGEIAGKDKVDNQLEVKAEKK
jgi:hyperosmotically inducible protein